MKKIKIILTQDIAGFGQKGDSKEVSRGYAKNFLLARKMAEILTPAKIKQIEAIKAAAAKKEINMIEDAKKIRERLKTMTIEFKMPSEKGHLFGSIGPKDIIKILRDKKISLSKKALVMDGHIKTTGEHELALDLGNDIKAKLHIKVKTSSGKKKALSKEARPEI